MCCLWQTRCPKFYKANRSITKLYLSGNKIGDKGACALADALRATLVTSFPHVRPTCGSSRDGYSVASNNAQIFRFLFSFSRAVFYLCCGQLTCPNCTGTEIHKDTGSICRQSWVILCGGGQISCFALARSIECMILARAAARQLGLICLTTMRALPGLACITVRLVMSVTQLRF